MVHIPISEDFATTLSSKDKATLSTTIYSSKILAVIRIFAAVIFTLLTGVVHRTLIWMKRPIADKIAKPFQQRLCKILGVKVVVRGAPVNSTPTLFVANHSSYLDIIVGGATIPARFVSKAEVGNWPVIGWMARMHKTVFIERKRGEAGEQKNQLTTLLQEGKNLILFPEGTTGDGARVLPFKSSLFSVVEEDVKDLVIQPVSITYSHVNGLPVGHHIRPLIAWYGDMALAGHLFKLAGLGQIQATVIFHDPIYVKSTMNRKIIANQAFKAVDSGVFASLTSRHPT